MRKAVFLLSIFAVDAWAAPPMGDAPAKLISVTPVDEAAKAHVLDAKKEELIRLTSERGFFELESALQAELNYAKSLNNNALVESKITKLAHFYAANDLHVEALAALKGLSGLDNEARLLAAKSHYAMGRYDVVLPLYEEAAAPAWLIAQIKTHLGAYNDAHRLFAESSNKSMDADSLLLKAEAAAALGEIELAKATLDASAQRRLESTQQAARQYFAALLSSSPEKPLNAIIESGQEPWASKAALQLLKRDFAERAISTDQAISDLEGLYLRSDDPSFHRDLAMIRADILRAKGDAVGEVASLRQVIDQHPQSDQAAVAELKIRSVLASLFDSDRGLSAIESAQLFYENIVYAPPGEEGDVLIRNIADRLVNLDLADSAAELLEHQVFNRLRGFERSEVAADLADIYLAGGQPEEAIRVLRSTRIAGLAESINHRRRLLEVRSLDASGRTEAALNLLDAADKVDERLLKANIYWRLESWKEAGAAYRDVLKQSPEKAPEAFMRAAVAFAMSNDSKALSQLLTDYEQRLGGSAEYTLAQSLIDNAELETATQSALSFMQAYREKYQSVEIGG